MSLAIAALTALAIACGGNNEGSKDTVAVIVTIAPTGQATRPSNQPTTTAQSSPASTSRPATITQAMLATIVINQAEVAGLYGATPFRQSQTNVTDIPSAFSSSPELGQFLTSQNVSGLYNAWTATTGQCIVCAVQVPVLLFPNETAASMAYDRIRQVNQAIFQNVAPVNGFSSYWNSSFCQTGTFTTMGAQTLNWLFCAARKGNAVIAAAAGGFNFNATTVGDAIRAYATRVENYLKTQFP